MISHGVEINRRRWRKDEAGRPLRVRRVQLTAAGQKPDKPGYHSLMEPFARLIGVYDADGGVVGELRYVVGKLTGSAHCALCDVTHGLDPRGKADWRACTKAFPIELVTVHRNEQDPALKDLTRGGLPCVVGERVGGAREVVVTREQLEACRSDVSALDQLLRAAIRAEP